jgi:hypothetical protein
MLILQQRHSYSLIREKLGYNYKSTMLSDLQLFDTEKLL